MLTFFTTAKPFVGHNGTIQRNALKSWKLLHRDVEVILFGDDDGAAEVCAELGLRHEPHVERNESGLKRIDYYFDRAQEIARQDVLCYVNCDIVLTDDFRDAVERVSAKYKPFLLIGRRWDTDIAKPIDFSAPDWAGDIRARALAENHRRNEWFIDYFAFSRWLYYKKIPPFVIGRVRWDNWLVWGAMNERGTIIDASAVVRAIHQNHNYGYHPKGEQGVWEDEYARRNFQLAGGYSYLWHIADAHKILTVEGFRGNPKRHWVGFKRRFMQTRDLIISSVWHPIWFSLLGITRPIRSVLGLRSKTVRAREKV
jgi:hypothetical protein